MFTTRLATPAALLCAATSLLLSGCSGSSDTTQPSIPQMQQDTAIERTALTQQRVSPHKRMTSEETAASSASTSSPCILIDTVYPKSDLAGLGLTAAAVTGGDNLNIDGTGCSYGIYLYPGAKNLRIVNALVRHASRTQILAEAVSGVKIVNTVVDGTLRDQTYPPSFSFGGIAFRGASGTVENAQIFNVITVGVKISANNGCFAPAPTPCRQSNVTVDQTLVDNSVSGATGDGFDVSGGPYPELSTAVISHSTVIGPNLTALPDTSEVDNNGAQVGFASIDGNISLNGDTSLNNQVGFDVYCSTSNVRTKTDLTRAFDFVFVAATVTQPQTPLPANQIINAFTVQQMDGAFGAGYC